MPLRLAILGASPCAQCAANCCKQNGHEYAALLQGDERRKFAPFALLVKIQHPTHPVIEHVLPYRDGRCTCLGPDDRCTIYEDRPQSCRQFECITGYHQAGSNVTSHSAFLQANPTVRELLD